jgi:hypothetical protein
VNSLAELADRQWRDYRRRQPGTCFADPQFDLSLAAAYELQDAVAKLRVASGDRLIGYKVGCTGPGTTQQFGTQGPIRGRLFESEVHRHGEALSFDDFAHLAIEGEMAVRIGPDGTITAAFPVIELHHFVFRGARKTLPELVANNGLNGGLCCHTTIGSHRRRISSEKALCLFRSMAASSHRASYGQCPAAWSAHSNGFNSILRTCEPVYCQDTLFLRERRSGSILFAEAIE